MEKLLLALLTCKEHAEKSEREFLFERGLSRLQMFNGVSKPKSNFHAPSSPNHVFVNKNSPLESVQLGKATVPRMFMGLWQFSSPAWGSASKSQIHAHFRKHVDCGFTAYGMEARHYSKSAFGLIISIRYGGPLRRCRNDVRKSKSPRD